MCILVVVVDTELSVHEHMDKSGTAKKYEFEIWTSVVQLAVQDILTSSFIGHDHVQS